jgi:hypothetical protein
MPTPRQYATNAERQAAYRARGTATARAGRTPPVPSVAGPRRWVVVIGHAQERLAVVAEEMARYWEARSDVWQTSERGEQLTERLAAMEEILDALAQVAAADRR